MNSLWSVIKGIIERIDNDTVIIIGLVAIAITYSFAEESGNIVHTIVIGLLGYLGGQYVNVKRIEPQDEIREKLYDKPEK
jgi:hypothetical protein